MHVRSGRLVRRYLGKRDFVLLIVRRGGVLPRGLHEGLVEMASSLRLLAAARCVRWARKRCTDGQVNAIPVHV